MEPPRAAKREHGEDVGAIASTSQSHAGPSSVKRRKSKTGRRRSTMACLQCRASKLKCDGAKPACTRCQTEKEECTWAQKDGRSARRKSLGGTHSDDKSSSSPIDLHLLASAATHHGSHAAAVPSQGRAAGAADMMPPSLVFQGPDGDTSMERPTTTALGMGQYMPMMPGGIGGIPADHRLWWEYDTSAAAASSSAASKPVVESISSPAQIDPTSVDWSTLGLGPRDLTQEVIDTLSGQIAWIDQPETMYNLNGSSHNQTGGSNNMTNMSGMGNDNSVNNSGAVLQEANPTSTTDSRLDGSQSQEQVQVVRLQYFRLLGPTGISPGIKKISMEFCLTPSMRRVLFDSDSPDAVSGRQQVDWNRLLQSMSGDEMLGDIARPDQQQSERLGDPSILFEDDLPAQWVLDELLPIFFDRLGDHYLCLNRAGLEKRLSNERHRVPPMLLNVMCALAARYSTDSRIVAGRSSFRSHTFGTEFADKAKVFLAPSLSVPSRTTTLAFLMMAWHEFACNLDSAFWMYAGLALRMSIDLGIHRQASTGGPRDLNDADFIDDALLFWAVYQMDRVLAIGSGRPTSIKDREITCPLPDHLDSQSHVNVVFGYHIRHTRIAGEIAEALNAVLSPDEAAKEGIRRELDRLEDRLIESYESIPDSLRLTPQNFQSSTCKHIFLEFHLRFHCLLLVLNRAPIVQRRTSSDPGDALRVVRKSVQRCADIVALDEAHDGQFLVCIPMANQTLFLAGCAELDECQQRQPQNHRSHHPQHQAGGKSSSSSSRSSRHLMLDAMESFKHFAAVLERMSKYFSGIRWIYGVLMQRKVGLADGDLIELDLGTDTLVSREEMRMLQTLHARNSSKAGSQMQWPAPFQVSHVVSLDELASVLPQFQSDGLQPSTN